MFTKKGLTGTSVFLAALILGFTPYTVQSAPKGERFIVQFKPGQGQAGRGALNAVGAGVALDLAAHNAVAAHIPATVLQGLMRNPNIEYIEDDVKRYPSAEEIPYGIGMVQADQVTEANAPIDPATSLKKVCIIDSGIDNSHPEFTGQPIDGTSDSGTFDWFTDENGHGTHVAGTIAARANGQGVVGVNPDGALPIHIIKVFDADGWAYSSNLIAALTACENAGADVVSMSLGGTFKSRTESRAFSQAADRGVLSIAAAGNDGNTRKSYPASYDSVVSVAAVDAAGDIADFSQQNDQVELAAPGVAVLSTVPVGTGTDASVTFGGQEYTAYAMDGSPQGNVSAPLVDCGLGETPCSAAGGVCLIQRGNISFADKVLNCEAGGGTAAIIYNNEAGEFLGTLGGEATGIPSVSVSDTVGGALSAGQVASVDVSAVDYAYFDGTSMATPHVSGVAALIWNNSPGCSAAEVRNAMAATAADLGPGGRDNAYGYGLVQAADALVSLGTSCRGGGSSGGGGGSCDLGMPGDSCATGSDCCSDSCKGKPGSKTCR